MASGNHAKMAVTAGLAAISPEHFSTIHAAIYCYTMSCVHRLNGVRCSARPLLSRVILVEGAKTLG
jgi:hypothetical protein